MIVGRTILLTLGSETNHYTGVGMVSYFSQLDSISQVSNVAHGALVLFSCGCLLGLGLAVSSLCTDSKTEARAHVLSVLDKLQSCWQSSQPLDQAQEVRISDWLFK